jgi:hypothetical protein
MRNAMASRWLQQLMATVGECWEWQELALQICFRSRKPADKDDIREVWVYPAVQEILGGQHDGETSWSGFHFDISRLLEELHAEQIGITTMTEHEPPQLTFEGEFRGRAVLLHVCLEPPEEVEATEIIDVTGPGGPKIKEKR